MWSNIAAFNGNLFDTGLRESFAEKMISIGILAARELTRECASKDFNVCS